MKIPVTDQFLWDLYAFLENAGDISHALLRRRRTMSDIYPENPVIAKYRHMQSARQFTWLVNYLKQNNYIQVESLKGRQAISITKRGIDKALMASFKADPQPKRKDGKWVMIIFDIPQKHPKARLLLRSVLENLGYKMFQQSVWVTPHDVSEKTETLLQHYNLDKYVRIFLTEEL